jgi:hypothetical protein
MNSIFSALTLRFCVGLALLSAPTFGLGHLTLWPHAGAFAQSSASPEKDAFEAAKELGTVEAWDAFLSNYPTGFHADLARAYVKKLAEGAPTPSEPAPPAVSVADEFPVPAGSWGGIVREGPGREYRNIGSLDEGEAITLMERSDVVEDGFPWFKIGYRGGKTGYKWGGILCATGPERSDIFKTCTAKVTTQRKAEPQKAKKKTPQGCASGRIKIDGKCILKRDAQSYCGPGYRLKGNTCVQGYKPPKPQKQLPSWQLEAIKKGCPKGMGWNAQEGCHEND